MKKYVDLLLALASFLCLVTVAAASQPKPPQAPKYSNDQSSPTSQGGSNGRGIGGTESLSRSLGIISSGGPTTPSGPLRAAPGVSSSGVATSGNGGGGIRVISCGSRRRESDASQGSTPVEKSQLHGNSRDQVPKQSGRHRGGAGGGVRLSDNRAGLGGGLSGTSAGGAQPGVGIGSSGRASPAEPVRPSNSGGIGNSNHGRSGVGVVDGRPGENNPSSGSSTNRGGGAAARTAGIQRGQRGDQLSGGSVLGSSSTASGASSGFPENGLFGSSSSVSVGFGGVGEGFPDGLGESSSGGNLNAASGGPGAPASVSSSFGFGRTTSGSSNGGVGGGTNTAAGGSGGLGQHLPFARAGYGRGSSASSDRNRIPGSSLSSSGSSVRSGVEDEYHARRGAGSFEGHAARVEGGPGRSTSASAYGGSERLFAGGGLLLNGGLGASRGSNGRPENILPPRGPTSGSSGIGVGSSSDLETHTSGSSSNGDAIGARESASGFRTPSGSQSGSAATGSAMSPGASGRLSTDGRGNGGATVTRPASETQLGPGDVSESKPGHDGTNGGVTRQNYTDSGSTNGGEDSTLSIPLGDGPLGLRLPRLFPRLREGHAHDQAVAAAVALGAIAGVAAVGALGAGIAAAVQASRRQHSLRPGGLRRDGKRRGEPKPGISRVSRESRSIPESKVPAEILDEIPRNFERLY